jgi:hypothetical protein
MVQRIAGDPQPRQHAAVGLILQGEPQRPRPHLNRSDRRLHFVEDHRKRLPLARRLTFDIDELRSMCHRNEKDNEIIKQLHRQRRLLSRRQFDRINGELGETFRSRLGEIDTRTPEHLPVIFDPGSVSGLCAAMRRMRGLTVKVTSTISSSVGL